MKGGLHFNVGVVLLSAPVLGQLPQTEMVRLETPPPPRNQNWTNTFFGRSLALGDGWLLAGDPVAGLLGAHGGEIYVYRDTVKGWRLSQRVTFGTPSSLFGFEIVLRGNRALVGAPAFGFPGNQEGRAYVYELNDVGRWILAQEIVPPGPSRFSLFGVTLAMDDDHIVVGTPSDSIGGGVGAFYVYEESPATSGGWVLQQQVLAPPGHTLGLGSALAVDGDRLFASAIGSGDSGQVTVYEQQAAQWVATQVLEASPPRAGDRFGSALSLRGDELLVGIPTDGPSPGPGAALLFELGGAGAWIERHEFRPSDGAGSDAFGGAVALGDGIAFVGARGAMGPAGQTPGRAYKFVREDGVWPAFETRQLVARNFDSGLLGGEIAFDGESLVVGDTQERAVFTYREELGTNECPWGSGDRARLRSTGSLAADDESLTLAARDLEPGALVVFAASSASAQIPFGDGTLCIGSPAIRLNRVPDVAAGLGVIFRDVAFDDPRLAGLVAGSTWTFQAWHTHSQSPMRRLTNAVRLTLN